jgi:hypothetical protein
MIVIHRKVDTEFGLQAHCTFLDVDGGLLIG